MKHSLLLVIFIQTALSLAVAQEPGSIAPLSAQKSLAATLEVYVFPSAGQDASLQSRDEGECYSWAVQNSGVDPFIQEKQMQQQQQQNAKVQQQVSEAGRGAGLKGAARGAAVGAIVGGVADDEAGKGAAIGAAVGAIGARRKAKLAEDEVSRQLEAKSQQTQQASAEQMSNFKKAFSVCLEAKEYMVKY